MLIPPSLVPGDAIHVVAPSGPFDDDLLRSGLARLEGFDVCVPEALWGRKEGFFAGSDDVRLSELQAAIDDPRAKAVLVARGGYGLARLLPVLDLSRLQSTPKWIVGFSDVTALHAALSRSGLASLHSPNGTTLARATPSEVQELKGLLMGSGIQEFSGLDILHPGSTSGTMFGGNLTVLFAEAASGRLEVPDGAILLLEDVTETSYRIDRMLAALLAGGHLERASGIVLGEFLDCSPGKFGVPTSEVLERNLAPLGVPIVQTNQVGHGRCNRAVLLGGNGELDSHQRTLRITST